jgi:calnexin
MARKPHDWENDIYGPWEPRLIPNPRCESAPGCGNYTPPLVLNQLYRGPWSAPLIPNPDYRGPWKPRRIPNPDYFEDLHPHNFKPLVGVGFELWLVNKGVGFNNIFIGSDESAVRKWNAEHFVPKQKKQEEALQSLKATESNLGIFKGDFRSAWMCLYDVNPNGTVILSVFVIGMPVVLLLGIWNCSHSAEFAERKGPSIIMLAVDNNSDENEGTEPQSPEEEADEREIEAGEEDIEHSLYAEEDGDGG